MRCIAARQLPDECAPTEPPVEPNPPRDADTVPADVPVGDDDPVEPERENQECDEEEPPPRVEEDEPPDRQGPPGFGAADTWAPCAAGVLQSLRGVSA
jgi:hypothetical protein